MKILTIPFLLVASLTGTSCNHSIDKSPANENGLVIESVPSEKDTAPEQTFEGQDGLFECWLQMNYVNLDEPYTEITIRIGKRNDELQSTGWMEVDDINAPLGKDIKREDYEKYFVPESALSAIRFSRKNELTTYYAETIDNSVVVVKADYDVSTQKLISETQVSKFYPYFH